MADNSIAAYEIDDKTVAMIDARNGIIGGFISTTQQTIQASLAKLGSISTEGGRINFELADVNPPDLINGIEPRTPDEPGRFGAPDAPDENVSLPTLSVPNIPSVTLADGISIDWTWQDTTYDMTVVEDLIERLQLGLLTGTGIGESLQGLLIENYFNIIEEQLTEERSKVVDYFSSRAIDAPAGVLNSQMARVNAKFSRMRQEAVRDTTAEVLKLEHEYAKHCQLAITKLEELKVAYHNSTQDRGLLADKTKWELIIAAFTKGIEKTMILAQHAKLVVDAEIAYADGMAKIARATSEIIASRWSGYKSHVEGLATAYKAPFDAYSAYASGIAGYNKAIAAGNTAQASLYEAQSQVAIANGMATIKAQEASIASMIKAADVAVAAAQAQGSIASQSYAAALNSVNLGATISASYNLTSSHSYDETKANVPGTVTSVNYNVNGNP